MSTCVICGNEFPDHTGMGRPPVTCSADCKSKRKQEQRETAIARAKERGIPDSEHGTANGYTFYKCPCAKCRGWSAAYQAARRQEIPHV